MGIIIVTDLKKTENKKSKTVAGFEPELYSIQNYNIAFYLLYS